MHPDLLGQGILEISADLSALRAGLAQGEGTLSGFAHRVGPRTGTALGSGLVQGFASRLTGGGLSGMLVNSLGSASVMRGATLAGGAIGAALAAMLGIKVAAKLAGVFTEFARDSVNLAANMQATEVAFKIFLGDAQKARALMQDLTHFAAVTPFELPEISTATKSLLAYGESGDEVVKTLRTIGDVAAGLSVPLNEMAEVYGKARVQGRAYTRDLHELTSRGVPILKELAKQFGVTEDSVTKLAEAGDISFANIEQAFKSMSAEGGMFANMMKEQSSIANGLYSTLHDNIQQLKRDFGDRLLPAVEETYRVLIRLTQMDFGGLLDVASGLAVTWQYGVLPAVEDAVYGLQAFNIQSQLMWQEFTLGAENATAQLKAFFGTLTSGAYVQPIFKTTNDEIERLRGELIKLGLDVAAAKSRSGPMSEAEKYEGKSYTPTGKKEKETGKGQESGLQALGEEYRKQLSALKDPKLKVAQQQLAEQKKTNTLLAKGDKQAKEQPPKGELKAPVKQPAPPAKEGKAALQEAHKREREAAAKRGKEWADFLRKSKGKGIPSYESPEAKRRRAAAQQRREQKAASNPLLQARAQRKAEYEASKAERKQAQQDAQSKRKKQREAAADKRAEQIRQANEAKGKLAREMLGQGLVPPPDVEPRRGGKDYEQWWQSKYGGEPQPQPEPDNLTPAERGRRNRLAAQRAAGIEPGLPQIANPLMQGPGFAPRVPERSRFQQLHGTGTAFDRFKLRQQRQAEAFRAEQKRDTGGKAVEDKTAEQRLRELRESNGYLATIARKIDKTGGLA